ncbi:MAG: FAD-dependent oxidoreductase [bacterium]|nr:FAD-dependent oxidoreductase [bacterium]
MANFNRITATLTEKKELAPLIHLITFMLNSPIQFEAGQYITLKIPSGNEIFDRPFSIASPPSENNSFQLLVKLIPGGLASTFFENATIGTSIEVSGPDGAFHIKHTDRSIHLVASSTGIAPFRSIIYDLLKTKNFLLPLELTFIVPPQEGMILKEELDMLKKEHANFSFTVIEDTASFFSLLNEYKDKDFYLCGGQHFVQDINSYLAKKSVDAERIHFEKFA